MTFMWLVILFIFGLFLGLFFIVVKLSKLVIDYINDQKLFPEDKRVPLARHGKRCFIPNEPGEGTLTDMLVHTLDPKEYYIFNNLIIPNEVTTTTEIDHVVISDHGVFVIENKDMKGYLYGGAYDKQWTQVLNKDNKYQFPNPLHQNYGHCEALKNLLPFIDEHKIFSVVAFSPRSEFGKRMPGNVLHYGEVPGYIKRMRTGRISKQRCALTIGKLSQLCQSPSATHEEHVRNISDYVSKKAK